MAAQWPTMEERDSTIFTRIPVEGLADSLTYNRGFIVNYKISSEFGENKDEGR